MFRYVYYICSVNLSLSEPVYCYSKLPFRFRCSLNENGSVFQKIQRLRVSFANPIYRKTSLNPMSLLRSGGTLDFDLIVVDEISVYWYTA